MALKKRRDTETIEIQLKTLKISTEKGNFPCDYGNKKSELEMEFPHHDFSALEEVWWTENETYQQVT